MMGDMRNTHSTIQAVFDAECCRVWVCAFGWNLGRCGYCGEVPQFIPNTIRKVDR